MHKYTFAALSIICLTYFGCSKSKQPGPQTNTSAAVKIEVVSGSNQTDTVGRQLANNIVIKVTQNGTPLSNYRVAFLGSGCNSDHLDQQTTGADGTSSYIWRLAGDVGAQTLKIYAVNTQSQKVDSVSASVTGLAPGPGWHYSACTVPRASTISSFCKLSTGRLFTTMAGEKAYLRYSDDNGISWNAVKGLGNTHSLQYVLSSASDELFAFAPGDGVYYSNDAGQTWTMTSTLTANFRISGGLVTPSGKLLITIQFAVYLSVDKGKTWTIFPNTSFIVPNSNGGGNSDFTGPAEDKSGNLYVVGENSGNLYKSTDAKTWAAILDTGPRELYADFYIDSNGWFYKSLYNNDSTGGIYISKDNGVTYTQFVKLQATFPQNISLQSDGNFYYDAPNLYVTNDISNTGKRLNELDSDQDLVYIVAKNNNIIHGVNSFGLIRYYQK